jgi:hypothetical protein
VVLKLEADAKVWLRRGPKDAPNVGDRCVFLDVGPAGARLVDGSVTGKNVFPKAGERLLIASAVTSVSFGGPLLDESGDYVGVLGGSIVPGGDPIQTLGLLSDTGATGGTTDWQTTGLAVPHTLLPDPPAASAITRLGELATRGEFLAPVVKSNSVQYATVTSAVTKEPSNMISPRDSRRVFSKRDNKAVVYVNWQTYSKEKLICVLRLLNADNRLISESKPREVSLGPGKYAATTWEIPFGSMPAGIYRLDLILNDRTTWRNFFRITD